MKPRRPVTYSMKEIEEALNHTGWYYEINIPLLVRDIYRALRRIARGRKKKVTTK